MSYNWEETKDEKSTHTCLKCFRKNTDGAQFNYHTNGVKTPEGIKKLPMRCTECWDSLRKEIGVPYMWLDVWVVAEESFDFYARKVEEVGGDHERCLEFKTDIIKTYIKACDNAYGQLMQEKITAEQHMEIAMNNPKEFVSNIAKAAGIHHTLISSGGQGFKKID